MHRNSKLEFQNSKLGFRYLKQCKTIGKNSRMGPQNGEASRPASHIGRLYSPLHRVYPPPWHAEDFALFSSVSVPRCLVTTSVCEQVQVCLLHSVSLSFCYALPLLRVSWQQTF
mmetsp:Transcript_21200/g.50314  ORF Transcript_21200/g.50314 Transcript_21200/m.50314 type:complete len:114 (-) Transcript_21200:45-386(-)